MDIVVATGNAHKLAELMPLFTGHRLMLPRDLGIEDFNPEENGTTFLENALAKARHLHALVHRPVLADDSGLCVDALGGAPGVLSARFGIEHGLKPSDYGCKNRFLLSLMEGREDRTCAFVCCLILYFDERRFFVAQETLEGVLAHTPRGEHGFGYDPIVYLPDLGRTVAELDQKEKNLLSHRGKAARRISAMLESMQG